MINSKAWKEAFLLGPHVHSVSRNLSDTNTIVDLLLSYVNLF